MADVPSRESADPLSALRTAKFTQTSSSVPSTPYQKPRDYRFHSRSPSPHRGIGGNHSPKSVASEAHGGSSVAGGPAPATAHRGSNSNAAPVVVCKFETGDEIRKRRIPYVDGGHEELAPPKKEPKKTLEPDERERLSGDMRELYDRLLPSPESEDRRARLVKKLERILNEEWPDNDIRVNVFGSSGNLLSSTDSDVDICITTPLKKLESMHSLATLLSRHGMEKVVCRAAAKVPIVKCWDPELELAADLNVNNPLALQNTKMIKTYVQLDDRVRPLAKIIKYWTKRRILNDAAYGGTISSYTWICMIISFLQRRVPPILPSLQKAEDCRLPSATGEKAPFADDVEALKARGNENEESLGELLFQFFRHYGYEFDYSKSVVSVREGRLVSRQEKGWEPSNYHDKEARNRLCVEEPFTVNRNLGNSADDYAWHGIHGEIRRAFDLLADGLQLEKCCEQYEFPPEEKHIFQRPAPKPKPTLTRSTSQSGRPDNQQSNGRSRKSNRNASAQRSQNRRASSGAALGNQRMFLPFTSPTIGGTPSDYFGVKGNLHEQLYQQYQFLQLQQDALRSQLQAHHAQQAQVQQAQVQQAQAQAQARSGDMSGSPRPPPLANGLPSPRLFENVPQTAPLLPGYLWHYPAHYLPPSPMSQTRSTREGTNTNPSSPSIAPAVPALRRQVHRASVPDVAPVAGRSQSQPGRSLPNAVTMQQQVHPGYDVSGAIPAQYRSARASQAFPPGHPGFQLPFSPPYGVAHPVGETSIPKEYVGYYVGQSPQLGPQQCATVGQMPPPPMTLRDPPQRPRRITPDLGLPVVNGRHSSRSPSPLSHHLRSFSIAGELQTPQSMVASPKGFEHSASALPVPPELDLSSGPIIVNGSNRSAPKPALIPNGVLEESIAQHQYHQQAHMNGYTVAALPHDEDQQTPQRARMHSLQLRTEFDRPTPSTPEHQTRHHHVHAEPNGQHNPRRGSSPRTSPTSRGISGKSTVHRLNLSPPNDGGSSHDGHAPHGVTHPGHHHARHHDGTTPVPLSANAPLLSPVAELRTPSPTRTRNFDQGESPLANGWLERRKASVADAHAAVNGKLSESIPASMTHNARPNGSLVGSAVGDENRPPGQIAAHKQSLPPPSTAVQTPRVVPKMTLMQIPPYKGGKGIKSTTANAKPNLDSVSHVKSSSQPQAHASAPLTANQANAAQPLQHAAPPSLTNQDKNQNQNQWQQATRKGHKKSKSTISGLGRNGASGALGHGVGHVVGIPSGQPIPANESERKGG